MIRTLVFLFLASTSCATSFAQDTGASYGVRMEIEDENGPISVLIGERLSRDAQEGLISMTGGVQIRRDPDILLIADQIDSRLLAAQTGSTGGSLGQADLGALQDLSQVQSLVLEGQVYAKTPTGQVQADKVTISGVDQTFVAEGSPVILVDGDQSIRAGSLVRGDMATRRIFATGGVVALVNGSELVADEIEVVLPPDGSPAGAGNQAQINASGSVQIQGPDFALTAGRAQTSPDGRFLYLGGGVTYRGALGSFQAGSARIDTQTQEFELNHDPDGTISAQGIIQQ